MILHLVSDCEPC